MLGRRGGARSRCCGLVLAVSVVLCAGLCVFVLVHGWRTLIKSMARRWKEER